MYVEFSKIEIIQNIKIIFFLILREELYSWSCICYNRLCLKVEHKIRQKII